jgi:hypothetical protein
MNRCEPVRSNDNKRASYSLALASELDDLHQGVSPGLCVAEARPIAPVARRPEVVVSRCPNVMALRLWHDTSTGRPTPQRIVVNPMGQRGYLVLKIYSNHQQNQQPIVR